MGYLREACIEAAGKAMPGWLTWEDVVGVVDAVLSVVADECDHAAAEVYYDDPKDTLEELIANDFARYSISRLASELRETP